MSNKSFQQSAKCLEMSKSKTGKLRFLITAGGTREYIDTVRFISNASSGKTGYAIAKAAAAAGHKVILISAASSVGRPKGVEIVDVQSSAEMFEEVKKHFGQCDCLVMAAAVSDYKPKRSVKGKIKKARQKLTLELVPTVDILKWAGRNKKGQMVVGFALEDKNLTANAEKKLKKKNLDMIVANSPSVIGADKSTVHIKTKTGGWQSICDKSKTVIAKKIIALILGDNTRMRG